MRVGLVSAFALAILLSGCGPDPKFSSPVGTLPSPEGGTFVDIRNYGARCDGTTDDSQAILAALRSGQPILIPQGICAVGSAIYFGGSRIEGASLTGSVLKWIGNGPQMPFPITTASVSGGIATINTATPNDLWQHETVVITGNSNNALNGSFIVTSIPSPTSFTYAVSAPNSTGSGGTAGMYYLLDSSKLPDGSAPPSVNSNAGWVSNLTIDCKSTSGVSGMMQLGDGGDATNIHIQNCLDGYTAAQSYMNPLSHVTVTNAGSQGAFIKNLGADNGAATGGSIWVNGFGTYGIHIRGTQGKLDLLYAQNGRPGAIYPIYLEGDGPGITRTTTLQCGSCVADSAGGINSFYIRRYYFEMDSPRVVTSGPSQDVFVFDDAWGVVSNADVYPSVAPGYYTFKSLGNSAGLVGAIVLIGGGGTIDPVGASDFSVYSFVGPSSPVSTTSLSNGSATDPVLSFISEPDLGWYRAENGMMALGSQGVPVFSASPGGVSAIKSFNLCSDPIVGPCYGGFGYNGTDELVTIDHTGVHGGANFTAQMLKLGANANDTGISRLAAGQFAFGNGTQGDSSGTIYSKSVVLNGTSAPAGAAVCFKADKSLGYCSTPFAGNPPACTCN